jgi:hypothetical protein
MKKIIALAIIVTTFILNYKLKNKIIRKIKDLDNFLKGEYYV